MERTTACLVCVRKRRHGGKLTYDMTIDLQGLVCGGEKMMSHDLAYGVGPFSTNKYLTKTFFMPMNIDNYQMILIITF